ncbi:TonB-dependent copper receptor [Wenzhouxiangella marina]|uniref:TonB-dependent copper receptor n=1 Tax=Wenzhouxiangella marina TaxID=1579979 RepID=A0A0K0XSI4_9GAMM|nr:TonB-dependent copper receptor [Wenzhouxiangella marina]AKS40586.1 TonB-dependent copper receptor [Wenzhouxiangella marina]MBB6088354.1 iron complex outermembrane receptor protein [Wenzhouxiangella marina]
MNACILRWPALLCACTLPFSAALAAEESPPEAPLETMVVTSPRVAPGQVSYDTQDLDNSRETGDLLRDITGVSGARIGGHGTDPVIRGLGQNRINVLLDGAFVHGACPNRMDPPTAYASASSYDRITVLRGVTTLEYGGGPGGTILMERHTERFQEGESARFGFDSAYRSNGDVRQASVDLSAGGSQGFLRVIGGWMDADNYEDGAGVEVRSAFQERSATLIAGWTPDETTRLVFSAEAQRLRDELFAGAGMDSPMSDNDGFRVQFESVEVGPWARLDAELFVSRVDHVMDNYSLRDAPSPMMLLRAPASSDTDGGRLVLEQDSTLGRWRYGLSIQNNARDAIRVNDFNQTLNSVLWPGVSIDQTGVFAELSRALVSSWQLTGGLRFDRVRAEAERAYENPPGMLLAPIELYERYNADADPGPRQEHHWGALLRLEHRLASGLGAVYATLSRSLRTADATERYIASNAPTPSRRWVGNPGLDPERHHQAELGLLLAEGAWNVEGSLFYNRIDDFILRDRTGRIDDNATVYRNVDATLWGGELNGRYRFGEQWRMELGLAYVRATNDDDHRPIAQTPPLEARLGLGYESDRWEAGIDWRAAARQRRVDDDPLIGSGLDSGDTPGWSVIDLRGRYSLNAQWRLEARIDNLLDRQYAEHLNRASAFDAEQIQVNEPGRSLSLRLSRRFD